MLGGATALALASLVAKLIGALYRIPLTNVLGAEGMGMYQLVFPIYALFLTLSTSGLSVALSRIVAEKRILGEPCKKYLAISFLWTFVLCLVSTILVASLAPQIALWQGNAQTTAGFWIIAPSIFMVGFMAVFRGWFQGHFNMLPTAISNLIEQIGKLVVGLSLAIVFAKNGVIEAVFGALVGVTASELIGLLFLMTTFFVKERKNKAESLKFSKSDFGEVVKISFPIALVAMMLPLSQFIDSFIIVNLLKLNGVSTAIATSKYGILSGPVGSLVNLPIVVLLSLAVAVVPNVSAERVEHNLDGILKKTSLTAKLTYMIGIPAFIFFTLFAKQIFLLLYPKVSADFLNESVLLLSISSLSILFMSGSQIHTALLQSLDKAKLPAINLMIAVGLKIVFMCVLTKYVGIVGSAVASVLLSFVAYLLNTISLRRYIGIDAKLLKNIGAILLSSVIMTLFGFLISYFVENIYVAFFVGMLVCILSYGLMILFTNVIEDSDTEFLPFGKQILKLKKFVRFWE